MREHIRRDTVKMFDTDEKHIAVIMEKYGITNRSEAHRKALELCASLSGLIEAIQANTQAVEKVTEANEELYFIVRETAIKK